jgi:hypothetical protein
MIRFDLDLEVKDDARSSADDASVDLRQPVLGIVEATEGEMSASASASGE